MLADQVHLSGFAAEFGELERSFASIPAQSSLCAAKGVPLSLEAMGCRTFWQMTQPLESYAVRSVARTLSAAGIAPDAVSHIVFSTMDKNLPFLRQDFASTVLEQLALLNCIPSLFSMQQCASSLGAINYARSLFANPEVEHVVVVAFDFVKEEVDRIQSFALFGDAVSSCLVSRKAGGGLTLLEYDLNIDPDGLRGRDNFESRKRVITGTMKRVLAPSNLQPSDLAACFSTNFYKPIAFFNAGVCGIPRQRLALATLPARAHCGNCDWMLNLIHWHGEAGFVPGGRYLAQAYAPGFVACALLGADPLS